MSNKIDYWEKLWANFGDFQQVGCNWITEVTTDTDAFLRTTACNVSHVLAIV